MPNGTGVSNIDLSRSPSHSLSPLRFHSALSLFLLVPLPPAVARSSAANNSRGSGEGRGKEGFTRKSQPKPRSGGHSPVEQTHAHASTNDAKLCPDRSPPTFKFHHFFFFHSILLRFRIGFASFYPLPIFLRKRTIPSLEPKICISRCTWIRMDICFLSIRFFDKIR